MATQKYTTADFSAMLSRMVTSYGKRLADSDPSDLADAVRLQAQLEAVIGQAVAELRATHGFSFTDIGRELGITRQAAQQRFARYCTQDVA
jgi:hypothetical protein